ncbi:MAG TPA: hypothetical protein VLK83_08330, partial [Rhodanobacteraceae bacterium]|nr:hypothetical protein [Rhodanobacteraceae bacterium]
HFYYAESDGCYKQPRWKAYWYGIADFSDIERCVAHCRDRPPTLGDTIEGGTDMPAETA